MYRIFTALVFVLSGYSLYAQERSDISGVVKDNTGAPVASATINLLNASDSSWIRSELTGDKGEFSFGNVVDGKYLLNVAAMGFEKQVYTVIQTSGIEIALVKKANELQEVVVKSKVPAIRSELGKTIVNFDQAAVDAGSNILDLLRRTPGVTVDGSGNVSMNGRGVLITINDKQTYLAGDDLVNYLKSISAEQVAQLDLINQPSAKYDAEGNNGIINIKLRRSKKAGVNGNVELSYGQGEYASTHNTANLNYRKNKLTLFINTGYLHGTGFLDQEAQRITKDNAGAVTTRSNSDAFWLETFEDYSLNVDGAYDVNDKLKIGGSVQGMYHPNSETDKINTSFEDVTNSTLVYNKAVNAHGFLRKNFNGNVNARYEPVKDHVITVNGDYISRYQKEHQFLSGSNYDAQLQELPDALALRAIVPRQINAYVAKADYSGAISKGATLEAGVKTSLVSNGNNNMYETFRDDTWQADTMLSNNYLYHENINAAYISAAKNLGKKWQAQLGFRVENTNIDGEQEAHHQTFTRSFTSGFPTAFVSYKPNDKHGFELNCGRRISRPSYRDLSPFIVYTTQYNYSSGNPELLPEFRYALSLRHNYKNTLFSEMTYARVTDIYNPVLLYNAITKAVYRTQRNNANKNNLHFAVNCNKQLMPWWMLAASYDWYYNGYEDYDGNALASSHGHSFGLYNQFTFGAWTIDTFYSFNSGDLQSLTERNGPSHWSSAGVSKKLWKDTAVVKLSLEDPFGIYRNKSASSWNGVEGYSVGRYATQQASLSFTYNFGKGDGSQRRSNNSDEAKRM